MDRSGKCNIAVIVISLFQLLGNADGEYAHQRRRVTVQEIPRANTLRPNGRLAVGLSTASSASAVYAVANFSIFNGKDTSYTLSVDGTR